MSESPAPEMRTHTMRTMLTLTLLTALALPSPVRARTADADLRVHPGLLHSAIGESLPEQRQQATQTDRTSRTVRLATDGELDVANISGDIIVQQGSGSDATIEITKTARAASDADAQELLNLVQVEITERPNRVEVRAHYPRGEGGRRQNRRHAEVEVQYNITVPAGVRVRAHSIAGSISARGVSSELSAESVSGSVTVEKAGRLRSAKSISGNVQITETSIDGPFQASSVSGNLVLRGIKAQQLDAGAISGDIILDGVTCPRVKVQTVSGDVQFNGPLPRNGRYELNSHSGDISVGVAGNAGFQIEATSFSGSVESTFPLEKGGGGDGSPRGRQRTVRGVYGDGSAFLNLTTFSGDIIVSKR